MEKRVFFFHCFRNAITFLPLLLFVVMGQFRFKVSSFFASVLLLVQLAPGRGQFGGYSLQPFQEFSEETREIVDDGWSDYVVGLHTVLDENGEERQEEYKIPISPKGRIAWVEDRKLARSLARAGNFYEARQQYMYILRKYNSLRARSVHDIQLELGQLLVIIGNPGEAFRSFEEALAFQPESHLAHYHMGMLSTRVGSFHEAIDHYKNGLFYSPAHCQTLHNLGSLLLMMLRFEEAQYYFDTAFSKQACGPKDILLRKENSNSSSHTISMEDNPKEYYASIYERIKKEKQDIVLLTTHLLDHFLGAFVAQVQKLYESTEAYLQYYYHDMDDDQKNLVTTNVLIHAGEAMYKQGLVEEAVAMWVGALDLHSDTNGLSLQTAIAVPLYLRAPHHSEDVFDEVLSGIANVINKANEEKAFVPYPEARCSVSLVLTSLELHFSATSTAPTSWFMKRGVELLSDDPTTRKLHSRVGQHRYLAERISRMLRVTTPSLGYVSPHLVDWHSLKKVKRRQSYVKYIRKLRKNMKEEGKDAITLPPPKPKIAFVSSMFRGNKTAAKLLHGFITQASAMRASGHFHVTLWVLGYDAATWEADKTYIRLSRSVDRVLVLPKGNHNLQRIRKTLAEQSNWVDAVVFVAPAQDDTVYWLAHGRYAPVQVVHGAQTGTTGLSDSVDYFLGADTSLHENAHFSHSEQLLRLRGRGNGVALPPAISEELPNSAKPGNLKMYKYLHGALFLFASKRYYYVPHGHMAVLHPVFDRILCEIVRQEQRAVILFAAPKGTNIAYERLITRIRNKLKKKSEQDRLRFLPALPRVEYFSLLAAVDMVLDPYPASGTNIVYLASAESLAIGTPVLTLVPSKLSAKKSPCPSKFPVAGMLRALGGAAEDFIAASSDEYIKKAISLIPEKYGTEESLSDLKINLRLSARKFLFSGSSAQAIYEDWNRFFLRVIVSGSAHKITLAEERVAELEESNAPGGKKRKRKHRGKKKRRKEE